eukprot:TRINITY_DN14149_c0_g1_i1.p1 TRINITY_DN14149_c0_g1~~TRINITY_DN14149_c0_g1_i1.p1  ORF type:complete len:273 (-),score=62.50 TRINITY_DN14149_c0_g1_i1:34-852(-)
MPTTISTFAFVGVAAVAVSSRSNSFRGTAARRGLVGMRPEVVARAFVSVEDEWQAQASIFADCNNTTEAARDEMIDCHAAPAAFARSCGQIVHSTVSGSGGDHIVVREYLDDVCRQNVMNGWRAERCHGLADTIIGSMTADSFSNRMKFDSTSVCSRFWTQFLAGEQERVAQDQARQEKQRVAREKAEQAKRTAADEAEKKATKEAAETAADEGDENSVAKKQVAAVAVIPMQQGGENVNLTDAGVVKPNATLMVSASVAAVAALNATATNA